MMRLAILSLCASAWIQPLFAQIKSSDPFHPDSLKQTVAYLSSDYFQGRHAASTQAVEAARFIASRFADAGLSTELDSVYQRRRSFWFKKSKLRPNTIDSFLWTQNFSTETPDFNVLAVLPGTTHPHEWVMFGAHYDHIGVLSTVGDRARNSDFDKVDTIWNGANDNASGVAGLISLAQKFASGSRPARTLLFVAFGEEENGLDGSQTLADWLGRKAPVVTMVNLEMLGRPATETGGKPFLTGHDNSDLIAILNRTRISKQKAHTFLVADPFEGENLRQRSDSYPFSLGRPAHTICNTSIKDSLYHSNHDEAETLDYESMSTLLEWLYRAVQPVVNATVTPRYIYVERPLRY